jgi:epsin
LTVLDYCLHQGSENVVIYFRDNIYVVKTLKEFQYVDEDGKDQGANVRQKAKDITNLLQDESRLREERRTRASMRDRMIRGVGGDEEPIDENISRRKLDPNGLVGKRPNRDEEELRRAIEESKKSLAQDRLTAEERDLQQALKLSQEEEEKRKQDMDSSNASALFDDTNQLCVLLPSTDRSQSMLTETPRCTQPTAERHSQQQPLPTDRPHAVCRRPAAAIHCPASVHTDAAAVHGVQPVPTAGASRAGGPAG